MAWEDEIMIKILKKIVRSAERQYDNNTATAASYQSIASSIKKYGLTMSEIDILPEKEFSDLDVRKVILQIITDLRYSENIWYDYNDSTEASYDSMYLSMIMNIIREHEYASDLHNMSTRSISTRTYFQIIKEYGLK